MDDPTPATPNAPTFSVVTLEDAIVRGDTTIGIVSLRKPRAGELRGLSMVDLIKLEVDTMRLLIPRISDPVLHAQDVDGLSPADLFACSVEVAGFFVPKTMLPGSLAQ